MLKKNIGTSGRLFRGLIGVGLLFYAWWAHSLLALIFALFVFGEAWFSWCLFYQLIGKNSCPKD